MEDFDDLSQFRSFGKIARLSRECIIYHRASGTLFKKTLVGDEKPKGSVES